MTPYLTVCLLVKILRIYGKLFVRIMGAQKMLQMKKYHVLIDKLNSFKQFDDENAESMYSRLNILVNEINSLVFLQANTRLNTLSPREFRISHLAIASYCFSY